MRERFNPMRILPEVSMRRCLFKPLLALLLLLLCLGAPVRVHAEWMAGVDLSGQSEAADRGTVVALLGEDTEQLLFSGGTLSTICSMCASGWIRACWPDRPWKPVMPVPSGSVRNT